MPDEKDYDVAWMGLPVRATSPEEAARKAREMLTTTPRYHVFDVAGDDGKAVRVNLSGEEWAGSVNRDRLTPEELAAVIEKHNADMDRFERAVGEVPAGDPQEAGDDAGHCDRCGAPIGQAGDGWSGLCGDCADREFAESRQGRPHEDFEEGDDESARPRYEVYQRPPFDRKDTWAVWDNRNTRYHQEGLYEDDANHLADQLNGDWERAQAETGIAGQPPPQTPGTEGLS
jgi:hypothetical protein